MIPLRLGILGGSEGNGHPYSWPAIINGYDKAIMKDCPFPVIPEYLSAHEFPRERIPNASVTHVWTQDRNASVHISKACLIEHVVERYTDMIGKVDAVLLARDDYRLHYEMSEPFLRAGLPVFIDKPLAITLAECDRIFCLEQYGGQIFSCSGLRYAREFSLSAAELAALGPIRHVDACVVKGWDLYGVHVIEPVLSLLGEQGKIASSSVTGGLGRRILTVRWESGTTATFTSIGALRGPINIRLFGEADFRVLTFGDTFHAFRRALQEFVNAARSRRNPIERNFVRRVIELIEIGNREG